MKLRRSFAWIAPLAVQLGLSCGALAVQERVVSYGRFSAMLKSDGTVWCWGGDPAMLGNYSPPDLEGTAAPVQAAGLSDVVSISAGESHVLALTGSGAVWAWGSSFDGQLGTGTGFAFAPAPVLATSGSAQLTGIKEVRAGRYHSLALKTDGTVLIWGKNHGYRPYQVAGLSSVASIGAGENCSFAVLTSGEAKAWGDNSAGQLGDGTIISRSAPVFVKSSSGSANLTGVARLYGGGDYNQGQQGFAIARMTDGSLRSWGGNNAGQLGDGTTTSRSLPGTVSVSGIFNDVAVGYSSCIALKSDG